MLSLKCRAAISCLVVSVFFIPSSVHAQKAGDNILFQTGDSNLSGKTPFVKLIPIRVPEVGKAYEVKINFLKAETSAAAVDAYILTISTSRLKLAESPLLREMG